MVLRIILVNVIVFIFQSVFLGQESLTNFRSFFGLIPRDAIFKLHVWQPFTYMFLHGSLMHLAFNMLITFFFGSALEAVWGGKRFLKYYIACGLGGAAFSFIFTFNGWVIGASGAVFGLYLAYAMLFPNNLIYLYFLFPIKAKYLVTFLAIVQLLQGIAGGSGIAYFAHLGGMAAGLLFFQREIMSSRSLARYRRQWTDQKRARRQRWDEHESDKIDSILDKIASKGYENLSTTEKRILENYSRKQKEDSE
jgi:membrane associated rhomboid family serine protease